MEFRFQHLLLSFALCSTSLFSSSVFAAGKLNLNNEYFEFGASAGVISIQDFTSELTLAFSATFAASEDFFLQYNYQYADIDLATIEKQPGFDSFFAGDDRAFTHYDLLLGYRVFNSEFFVVDGYETLGSLYVVAGLGNVSFGGEDAFSTTVGVGYKVGLNRKWNLRVDYRDYTYQSVLSVRETRVHNTSLTVGLSYLL